MFIIPTFNIATWLRHASLWICFRFNSDLKTNKIVGKSSAQESSEPNDDGDTEDEGDKDEDDRLETQSMSRTLSLYITF